MKEKDPIGNQLELTGKPNPTKLGSKGNNFMVDDRGTEEPMPPAGPDVGEAGPQNPQTGRAEINPQTAENLKLEAAIAKVVSLGFDPEMVRGQLSNAVNNIAKNRLEAAIQGGGGESESDPYGIPDSFEALVRKIEKQASENFKRGGENALITETGEVSKENFMAWIRDRMVFLHEFNPSSSADFFGGITIKAGISTISFYEMIFTGSYFLKKEVDEHGNPTYHQDDDYEKMKDQLITEAFVFGYSRNTHVEYTRPEIMGDERKLPEALLKLHYANPFTRGSYFKRFLTLPSMSRDKIQNVQGITGQSEEDFSKDRIKMMLENDSSIGEGVRRALLTYYHIGDYDMLKKIMGPDSVLFKATYDEYDDDNGKLKAKDGKKFNDELGKQKYDAGGNLIKDEDNIDNFRNYINIFNSPVKEESIKKEVRERIIQTLMSTLKINRVEAKYAEAIAFSMTRWSGIGAKNDTEAAAYDAWTKPQKLLAYRLKQLEEKRRGVAGNIFNLLGIKRASLSWMEGITDEKGHTLIEAVQGGQGDDFSENNPFAKGGKGEKEWLSFGENVSTAFIQNHVLNAFGIYNFIVNHEEFNMEQMVTYDEFNKPIIDQKKANEMIDKIQKWIRYAYCTWKLTDYGKEIRNGDQKEIADIEVVRDENGNKIGERQKRDRNGKLATKMVTRYRNMPIGAAMFGEDIIRLIDKDMRRIDENLSDNNKLKAKEDSVWDIGSVEKVDFGKMNDPKVRDYLWKQILTFFIAEEIESHRNINSEMSRFNYATLERIYDFLEKKDLVGKEAVEEIRNISHTSEGRVLLEEGSSSILLGFLGGLWKEIRKIPTAVIAK